MEPTTQDQRSTYFDLMITAYVAVFSLSAFGLAQATLISCSATGILDLRLYLSGKVQAKLPLAIPLGIVGILGTAFHASLS